MDRLHHSLEDGVEDLARLLGVAGGEQLQRTLRISEQDGRVLALAFQGSPGREDLFCEVLRSVRLRRG
jgi:hypothetical protein